MGQKPPIKPEASTRAAEQAKLTSVPIAPSPQAVVWLVQLGYFESRANAEQRVKELAKQGMEGLQIVNAEQFPGLQRKQGNYVVIGPASEAKVREILDKAKLSVADAFVVNGYKQDVAGP